MNPAIHACEALATLQISTAAINPEIWDVLPGYLVFRSLMSERPPTDETVRALVDDVVQQRVLTALERTPWSRCAGGSAANTIIAVADFGGGNTRVVRLAATKP